MRPWTSPSTAHRLLLRRDEQAGDDPRQGSAGPGVAENMMSGTVIIDGDASQYAGPPVAAAFW
jgi:hypothetical protein